jgi:hypothetical protein
MKELQEKLQAELDKSRALCSTNDNYYYAYSYGIEFALNLIKNLNIDDSDFRYKFESDKSLIYDSKLDKDICMYFDEQTRDWLLKLLNSYVE